MAKAPRFWVMIPEHEVFKYWAKDDAFNALRDMEDPGSYVVLEVIGGKRVRTEVINEDLEVVDNATVEEQRQFRAAEPPEEDDEDAPPRRRDRERGVAAAIQRDQLAAGHWQEPVAVFRDQARPEPEGQARQEARGQ